MKIKSIIKTILWTIAIIIAIPVILIATLPLWLGPIARPSINAVAPGFTGTSFNLGHLSLNPYTGRFELGDLVVGNPEGYNEPVAVAVSNLVVDVAMDTLDDKYIHVEDVVVEDLFLCVVKGGQNNVDNLLQIQYNIAGGKEQYEANMEKDKQKKAADQEEIDAKNKAEEELEKSRLAKMTDEEVEAYHRKALEKAEARELAEKKFVIDHLLVRNVKVKYGFLTLPIPTLELRDIGKESEGVNFTEFFDAIWKAIIKSASSIGDGAKALGGLIGDGAGALGDAAGAVGNAVGDAAGAVGGAMGDAAGAVGGAVGDTAKAVGDGASKTVNAATDAIKGLFK